MKIASLFAHLDQRFSRVALPFRVLALLVLLLLIYSIWYNLLHGELAERLLATDKQMVAYVKHNQIFGQQVTDIEKRLRQDPSLKENDKRTQSREEIALLNKQGQVVVSDIVTTNTVLKLFSQQLKKNEGVTLLSLDSMSSKPLLEAHEELDGSGVEYRKLDKNTVMVKFMANYFSTLDYLQALEHSQLRIFWDSLSYEVRQFPLAIVSLRVHFISHQSST